MPAASRVVIPEYRRHGSTCALESPTRGLLAPAVFIPIAEKSGAIIALGHWVLDQACRQMSIWRKSGLALPIIAINLSLFQLKSGRELVRDVTETIAKWSLAPSDLSSTSQKRRWRS
jgi:EAL domain-containing protein (putative c-di-GMP-specific phosphodiesterase class I)